MSGSDDAYNKGGYYAFLFSMVLSLGLIFVLSFFYKGIEIEDVDDSQPTAEQTMAGGEPAKKFDIDAVAEPWVYTDEIAKFGQKPYKINCASCHGNKADGKGPAGAALIPPPRNLINGGWKQGGTSQQLFVTLQKGIAGTSMAAFQHIDVKERWAMVHYIRSITKDKPADDAAALAAFGKTAK